MIQNFINSDNFTLAQLQFVLVCGNEETIYNRIHNVITSVFKRKGAFIFDVFFASSTFDKIRRDVTKYAQSLGDCEGITINEARQALAHYVYNEAIEYLEWSKSNEHK